jgi:SAM-dependent methyltransferase
MTGEHGHRCRSCADDAVATILDLGPQPVADDLCDTSESARGAPRHRLALGVCQNCTLVQLDSATPLLANAAHGHGSGFSETAQLHEREWAATLMALPALPGTARVLDVAGTGGALVRPFAEAGHEVQTGFPVQGDTGGAVDRFDLVLVNHTLNHADDLDAAVAALARSLAPGGTLAVEFHDVLGVLANGQFDVICHAHRSYLSLTALAAALERHGLTVTAARRLPLHGGVVRVEADRAGDRRRPDEGVRRVLAEEEAAGLGTTEAWLRVAERAARTRTALVEMLAEQRAAGRSVAAYGAPSRGITLLNYCGIDADAIPRTADRSPAKQGLFLPGVGTAVCSPEELAARRPEVVVVLVWPLRDEVLAQLADLRRGGTRFLFPLPEPELVR